MAISTSIEFFHLAGHSHCPDAYSVCGFAPVLAPYDPNEQNIIVYLSPPSAENLLGTDQFGRDVLSRLLYGARYSLTIGFLAIVVALIIGSFLGMIAGYMGRKTDIILMQIMDVVLAFPSLILGLALVALMGQH